MISDLSQLLLLTFNWAITDAHDGYFLKEVNLNL